MQIDPHDIVHEYEIAPLLAVAIAARSLEQPDPALGAAPVEAMEGDRRHASLMLLTRHVDVGVAEAGDLRGGLRQAAAHHLVEQEFGVALHIARRLELAFLAEHRTAAIHRCRRRVEQAHVLILTVVEQLHRVARVIGHHVAAVLFHRVGARALVQDGFQCVVEFTGFQAFDEFLLVEIIGDLAIDQVAELVRPLQIVDRDDVGDATLVERLDQIGADKAGRAGDDVIHLSSYNDARNSSSVTTAVPSLPTTMPAARLAIRMAVAASAPLASMTASVAITVSPAPLTS